MSSGGCSGLLALVSTHCPAVRSIRKEVHLGSRGSVKDVFDTGTCAVVHIAFSWA